MRADHVHSRAPGSPNRHAQTRTADVDCNRLRRRVLQYAKAWLGPTKVTVTMDLTGCGSDSKIEVSMIYGSGYVIPSTTIGTVGLTNLQDTSTTEGLRAASFQVRATDREPRTEQQERDREG